ncbi:M48 family metalloprotease [Pirellulaceae bacterium SH449]
MPITFTCPDCQTKLRVADSFAGRKARCTKCNARVDIPNTPDETRSIQLTQKTDTRSVPPSAAKPTKQVAPKQATPQPTVQKPTQQKPSPSKATVQKQPASAVAKPSVAKAKARFSDEAILNSIGSPIVAVPTTWGYTIAMSAVAIVMVLLPLLYLGMILGLCWGTFRYTQFAISTFSEVMNNPGRSSRGAFMVFAPIVIAIVAIFFMIKPLLARPGKQGERVVLDRKNEPLLFAYIEKLCRCVHAPVPKRIDVDHEVNASASLRSGLWSIFRREDLVLTIGLPLVNGLSLREFSGVLAHEFGHFSQGAGMRITYVVRSVNAWFARVVYERDEWDERLQGWASGIDFRIGIILYAAMFFVWLTRRILWCLMMIGHAMSCMLMRQMEYDADLHEIRFAGSEAFVSTCQELGPLAISAHMALAEVGEFFQDGKLVDDLPHWIRYVRKDLPKEILDELAKSDRESPTGLLDTHPANRDRIAAAKKWNSSGKIEGEFPASALFRHLGVYQKQVTINCYRDIFEEEFKPDMLASVEQLRAHRSHAKASHEASVRWFGEHFGLPRAIQLPSMQYRGQSANQLLGQMAQSRNAMKSQLKTYEELSQALQKADDGWVEALQALTFHRSGLTLKQSDWPNLNVGNPQALAESENQFRYQCGQLHDQLVRFEQHVALRTDAAVQLLFANDTPESLTPQRKEAWLARTAQVLSPLTAMNQILGPANTLRNEFVSLVGLLNSISGNKSSNKVDAEFKRLIASLNHQLSNLSYQLAGVPYPFEHAQRDINLVKYLIPKLPDADDPTTTIEASNHFLNQYGQLYFRTFGSLACTVEEIEQCVANESSEAVASLQPISQEMELGRSEATDSPLAVASSNSLQNGLRGEVPDPFHDSPAPYSYSPPAHPSANTSKKGKHTLVYAGLGVGCLGIVGVGTALLLGGLSYRASFRPSNNPGFSAQPPNVGRPTVPVQPNNAGVGRNAPANFPSQENGSSGMANGRTEFNHNESPSRGPTAPNFSASPRGPSIPSNPPAQGFGTDSSSISFGAERSGMNFPTPGSGRSIMRSSQSNRTGETQVRYIINEAGKQVTWMSPNSFNKGQQSLDAKGAIKVLEQSSQPNELSQAYRDLAVLSPTPDDQPTVVREGIRSLLSLPTEQISDLPVLIDGVWAVLHWANESDSTKLRELASLPAPASELIFERVLKSTSIDQAPWLMEQYLSKSTDFSTRMKLDAKLLAWGPDAEATILEALSTTDDFAVQSSLLRLLKDKCGTEKSIEYLSQPSRVREFFAKNAARDIRKRLERQK